MTFQFVGQCQILSPLINLFKPTVFSITYVIILEVASHYLLGWYLFCKRFKVNKKHLKFINLQAFFFYSSTMGSRWGSNTCLWHTAVHTISLKAKLVVALRKDSFKACIFMLNKLSGRRMFTHFSPFNDSCNWILNHYRATAALSGTPLLKDSVSILA